MPFTTLDLSKQSGVVETDNLGSGTANSSTVLYGDQTFKAEPSGAFVSLASSEATANTSGGVTFDNVFSSTYTRYMLMMDYCLPTAANVELRYKWRTGTAGSNDTLSNGYVYSGLAKRHANTDNYSNQSSSAAGHGVLTYNIQTGNGEHGVRALFDIYKPGTVDGNATMMYIVGRGTYRSYNDDSSQSTHFYVASNNYNTGDYSGINLHFNSGDIDSHKIRLYGVIT
jgi:hypothetical protein